MQETGNVASHHHMHITGERLKPVTIPAYFSASTVLIAGSSQSATKQQPTLGSRIPMSHGHSKEIKND